MRQISLILFIVLIGFFTAHSQTLPKNTHITGETHSYTDPYVATGTKIELVIHSPGLENNLLGDSPDRKVSIYLPPGYENSPTNRYPVVYFLHGFTQDHDQWWGGGLVNTDFRSILDGLITMNRVTPMIVVVPSSYNKYRGSLYTNSTVTGKWEDFIVHDVVHCVDSMYRTLPTFRSRGIAGHSMGGYGTIKLGMKNPDIFSAAYALSPAFLVLEDVVLGTMKDYLIQAVQSDSFTELPWQAQTSVAAAAAFAPNPVSLPYYGEFPVTDKGILIDSIWQKWLAHDPYTMIPMYKDSLLRLRAIQFDCGTADYLLFDANVRFSQALNDNGIEHTFEKYQGDHINKLAERVEEDLLPFFSKNLDHMVPGISRISQPVLESGDTLIVEMDADGMIYVVPVTTIAVSDTLAKYQTVSAIATANSEVKIPLTGVHQGDYMVYGLDNAVNGVAIPLPIVVVNDTTVPILTIE